MERFAIPGYQLPDAPKDKVRTFANAYEPLEVVFLRDQPMDAPLRSFDFYIALTAGAELVRLLAYCRSNAFTIVRPDGAGGKDYLIRIMPDELILLPATYTLYVMEDNVEVFKTIVNLRNRPFMPHCYHPPGVENYFPPVPPNCDNEEEQMKSNSLLLGPPTTGTFALADIWCDGAFALWRCITPGVPGAWIQQQAAVLPDYPASSAFPGNVIILNYLVVIPSQGWSQFYWNGTAWKPAFLQPLP